MDLGYVYHRYHFPHFMAANALREQEASYRKLARRARTESGSSALTCVAYHFDADARKLDPSNLSR